MIVAAHQIVIRLLLNLMKVNLLINKKNQKLLIKVYPPKVKIHIKEKESDWILSHKRKKTIYIHQILKTD